MDIFIWFLLLALWLFVALRDARRREMFAWDLIEGNFGDESIRSKHYGWMGNYYGRSVEYREQNFSTTRTAGRVYALITGLLRSPFIMIGLVIKLCWQPFRPLVAIVFARPTAKK